LEVSKYAIVGGECGRCYEMKLNYDGIARGGAYSDAFRDMILRMKFNDSPELDEYLGPIIGSAFIGSGFYDKIEMLVPVPLHWRRRLMRGFNQAEVLSRKLGIGSKPIDSNLVRMRYTHHQWSLDHAGRKRNVKGAFAVRKGHEYQGRVVCLVDDITTSGATLNECAKVLKEAGAREVYALVAAVGSTYGRAKPAVKKIKKSESKVNDQGSTDADAI
jgi:ComF family protein